MRLLSLQEASRFVIKSKRPQYKVVPESEIAPLPGAHIVGRPNPARRITVTVLLKRSPARQLESVEELGAQLPGGRRYLSRKEFALAHGAEQADVEKVIRFAHRHGLHVTGQHLAARTIHLSGSIASFSRAFKVDLRLYSHKGGIYRGRTGSVHVPLALHGVVQGVFGLDNRPAAKPHFRHRRELGGVWAHASSISYTPTEVAGLYSFPEGVNGAGQCIGLIELGGGYRPRDLNIYFKSLGIPKPVVASVPVAGGLNRPTGNGNGPDGEVMLDIEVAGSIAPGAKIVVYFAPNTNQGFLRAVNRAIHDQVHRPSIISISWGGPEAGWTQQTITAFNEAFQAAASMGISVCVAAGDGGSSDGVPGRTAHVDFPASSPFVLACGGTSLQASGGAITSESVWNDGPSGGAGGGGISDAFLLPSWQSSAGVPPSVNPGGHIGRGLPDVAGNADEDTGYQVRVDGVNTVIGGTSAVAPLMAGLIARLNESLGANIGYWNPLLYSKLGNSPAFHDITQGDNDMTGHVGGYQAGRGWDACSGFGSPNGAVLLAELKGPAAEPVTTQSAALPSAESKPPKSAGSLESSSPASSSPAPANATPVKSEGSLGSSGAPPIDSKPLKNEGSLESSAASGSSQPAKKKSVG